MGKSWQNHMVIFLCFFSVFTRNHHMRLFLKDKWLKIEFLFPIEKLKKYIYIYYLWLEDVLYRFGNQKQDSHKSNQPKTIEKSINFLKSSFFTYCAVQTYQSHFQCVLILIMPVRDTEL